MEKSDKSMENVSFRFSRSSRLAEIAINVSIDGGLRRVTRRVVVHEQRTSRGKVRRHSKLRERKSRVIARATIAYTQLQKCLAIS